MASAGLIDIGPIDAGACRTIDRSLICCGDCIYGHGGGLIIAWVDRLQAPDQLTQAGFLPGFTAGLLVIIGNPEAMLFYIRVLPGFFDVTRVTRLDILVVGLV